MEKLRQMVFFFWTWRPNSPSPRGEKHGGGTPARGSARHETAPTIEQRLLAESPIVANVASVVLDVVLAAL